MYLKLEENTPSSKLAGGNWSQKCHNCLKRSLQESWSRREREYHFLSIPVIVYKFYVMLEAADTFIMIEM